MILRTNNIFSLNNKKKKEKNIFINQKKIENMFKYVDNNLSKLNLNYQNCFLKIKKLFLINSK